MILATTLPPHLQLDCALQDAFVRAEFDRLLAFACWCAGNTVEVSAPAPWKAALALARLRANGQLAPELFRQRQAALRDHLPVAAPVIGLKHGVPSAATLLAVVAALGPGPLSAALGASSHQRLHARLRARREAEGEAPAGIDAVVDIGAARCRETPGTSPSVAELQCARWQLAVWASMAPGGSRGATDPGPGAA